MDVLGGLSGWQPPHIPMRKLLAPLALLGLSSCLATQGALEDLNVRLAQANAAAIEAKAKAESPDVTQAELDEAMDLAITKATEAKDAVAAVGDAVAQDIEKVKTGITGLGGLGDGGAVGLVATALAWYARDRRKRRGLDPLQLAHIKTPPTQEGS